MASQSRFSWTMSAMNNAMSKCLRVAILLAGVLAIRVLTHCDEAALAGVKIQTEVPTPAAPPPKMVIYADGMSSFPYTPSGWMGNQKAIRLDEKCMTNPHEGETCMKLQYLAPDQWGGVIWQNPTNDWGDKPGGYNLTGATAITFWARGESGGEKVKFVFGVIKPEKRYFDTANAELEIELTNEWARYSIDLTGKNLTRIKTGFGWTVAGQGKVVTFYLDDIQYE